MGLGLYRWETSCACSPFEHEDDIRASELEPGDLVPLPYLVAFLDSEPNRGYLCHANGQDGDKAVLHPGINDDTTSRLDKLIACSVYSIGFCFERAPGPKPESAMLIFRFLDLEIIETWDDVAFDDLEGCQDDDGVRWG